MGSGEEGGSKRSLPWQDQHQTCELSGSLVSSSINPQNPRTSQDEMEVGAGATTRWWDAGRFLCATGGNRAAAGW